MSNTTDNTQHMTAEEAVQILREHNEWRRDMLASFRMPQEPRTLTIGIAIDTACDAITALQQQLAGSEQAVATQRNAICNVTAERDHYKAALAALHDTAGQRMMADEPTGAERKAFLDAWTAAGQLLKGGAR